MYFYEVLVASMRYHGMDALTYQFPDELSAGAIVAVPLQRQTVVGVVAKRLTTEPGFATKPITKRIGEGVLPQELFRLIEWLKDYYPAPLGSLLQLMLPSSLLQTSRSPHYEAVFKTALPPPLTVEQQKVVKAVRGFSPQSVLLHGETGTGKSRVYVELTAKTLMEGKSAIVLTPEIGLTPQLAFAFQEAFGSQVVILHSTLTPAERRNRWLYILNAQQPLVVIGPRSALFAPLHAIGLIVLDEAHDTAYKQEQQPYYLTSRVAAALASLHKAQLVLGTATPLVADYYTFKQKNLPILHMHEQAIQSKTDVETTLVELTDRTQFSRSPYLSNTLIDAIQTTINQTEQSLIFLNRRGTARLILCEQCGWTATCPNCDLSLTYHGDQHKMHCHVCNYSAAAPTRCPECGHTDIAYKSIGTKTLEAELKRFFPEARIRRFDTDLKKHERLEQAYEDIRAGNVDILVGTQMLAKGLDLPRLGLVGIVVADTSLFIPDFSAEEHTYQLLSQIMGRVGRGHRHGRVIVQTYHPEHAALQAAIEHNYEGFYNQQITEREMFRFPPFSYLLQITLSRASSQSAQTAAEKVRDIVASLGLSVEITGPSPAFHEKTHGKYHWQLIIKSRTRKNLLTIIGHLPGNTNYDIDPVSLI